MGVTSQLAAPLWNPQVHQQRLVDVHHHHQLQQHRAHRRSRCKSHILLGKGLSCASDEKTLCCEATSPYLKCKKTRVRGCGKATFMSELMASPTSSLKSLSVGATLSNLIDSLNGTFSCVPKCSEWLW